MSLISGFACITIEPVLVPGALPRAFEVALGSKFEAASEPGS